MSFWRRKRRLSLGPCLFCSLELKPKDQVAALQKDVVRRLHGRPPAELEPKVDLAGNERWFAHLACFHSAAFKEAGQLDTTCVLCGNEVPAKERELGDAEVRKMLRMNPRGQGEPDPMERLLNAFEAATHAWQCQRCARWQCNRCVCAALAEVGPRIPDHADCGGQFAPPT